MNVLFDVFTVNANPAFAAADVAIPIISDFTLLLIFFTFVAPVLPTKLSTYNIS